MSQEETPNPLLLATPVYALVSFLSQWPGAPEQVRSVRMGVFKSHKRAERVAA
jgi:hypothetical protein